MNLITEVSFQVCYTLDMNFTHSFVTVQSSGQWLVIQTSGQNTNHQDRMLNDLILLTYTRRTATFTIQSCVLNIHIIYKTCAERPWLGIAMAICTRTVNSFGILHTILRRCYQAYNIEVYVDIIRHIKQNITSILSVILHAITQNSTSILSAIQRSILRRHQQAYYIKLYVIYVDSAMMGAIQYIRGIIIITFAHQLMSNAPCV